MPTQSLLKRLPSVDEVLRSPEGERWCAAHPRRFVLDAVRGVIDRTRAAIVKGELAELPEDPLASLAPQIESAIAHLCSLSLRPLINATGVVMHTNLGRSALSDSAIDNITRVARGYSNLEYDLVEGKRGKRYSHIRRLLRTVTGAEDGIAVNNNAGAVLLCLSALARGREVIVSRGELVEIGGSFRVPEVMAQSGAILKEVGATNKTHLRDYENALTDQTAMILKVHRSNFKLIGFTEEPSIEELVALGKKRGVPVMFDVGSGCLVDLKPYGIHGEPTVQEIVKAGPDIVTFSGDKLLGGPQAGMIVGGAKPIERISKHPLLRALRIDKLTLAALEATLMGYADPEAAKRAVPTLRMLLDPASAVKSRARRIAGRIAKEAPSLKTEVAEDVTFSGGGALPGEEIPTWVVRVVSDSLTPNQIEQRLRLGSPPVIGRIKDGTFVIDARTVADREISALARRTADIDK